MIPHTSLAFDRREARFPVLCRDDVAQTKLGLLDIRSSEARGALLARYLGSDTNFCGNMVLLFLVERNDSE